MKSFFKVTPTFTHTVESIGDEGLLKDIHDANLENPSVGSTIAGTGGLRKFRVADPSRSNGKRGGLRLSSSIYLTEKQLISYSFMEKMKPTTYLPNKRRPLRNWCII